MIRKIFEGEMSIRTLPTTLFKYLVKSHIILKLLSKVSLIQTTVSKELLSINGLTYSRSFIPVAPMNILTILFTSLPQLWLKKVTIKEIPNFIYTAAG